MIFFSIGLPSRFSQLCDMLILRLAERAFGSVELAPFNSFDDIAKATMRGNTVHFVSASRQPAVRLQTEIVEAGRPFVAALGDVRSALHDLLRRPGCDLATAASELASSCSAMLTLTKAPGALVLPGAYGCDPHELGTAIAAHLGLPVGTNEIAAVADSLLDVAAAAASDPADAGELSTRQQAIVDGLLQPYVSYFAGGDLEVMVWEPDLFFLADEPTGTHRRATVGPVDVTGRARNLLFGPYINLAPGPWSATVAIAFSAETAGNSFVIEVAAGRRLALERVQPIGEQVIETNLQFTIENSIDQPVEIRIASERAAFDGRLALGYASLAPRAAFRVKSHEELIESLRQ
ncbi:MAG: hypothetical protein JO204_17210 [Alphaproteobacteria bacterium]|nr:hypothetical protein [Alphaproteobacteria bacterium]